MLTLLENKGMLCLQTLPRKAYVITLLAAASRLVETGPGTVIGMPRREARKNPLHIVQEVEAGDGGNLTLLGSPFCVRR